MKPPNISPGKWRIARDILGDAPYFSKRAGTNGREIHDAIIQCEAFTMAAVSGESLKECRANARAIAAVPAVLRALENAVIDPTHPDYEEMEAERIAALMLAGYIP